MNRINKLFNEKKQNILSLYFCAGHPTAGSTADIIRTLAARGIDMLEIGIPFSDPTDPSSKTLPRKPCKTA